MDHGLNERQLRFADYYIEKGNVTEAYKMAGYDWKTEQSASASGSRLLKNAKVSAYISFRMSNPANKRIADGDEVLEFFTSVMRGETTGKTLIGVGMGEQVISDIEPTLGERINAGIQLGKRHRLWIERQETETTANVTINGSIGDTCPDCNKHYRECEC
ncbi:terminase small subunit [Bacillus cereus]|nr:terminase small subunit [Bacillus cereus]MEB8668813.1 terminase small subunit [Bacillus cereus]MEC3020896.1 terminase small subunit [Bacillus cereus]MEC3260282.1 terminase small subunit [Bacillus cereus]HDR7453440.1 terminase small subunit [Bacillus cereus]